MPKSQKDPGQGDLYQWLTVGSLGQATCVRVYPGGRLSRTRKGRRTSVKFCIWTEHSACISQIQTSTFFFLPPNRTTFNLFKLFHLWMGFIVSLPWHVLPPPPITFFQSERFGRKLSVCGNHRKNTAASISYELQCSFKSLKHSQSNIYMTNRIWSFKVKIKIYII